MSDLRLKGEKNYYADLNGHLNQRSKIYERNLHIKNLLRMQELLDEESFRKWKKLRFSGENPPVDRWCRVPSKFEASTSQTGGPEEPVEV